MSKLHKAHKTKHVNIKSDEEDREDKIQAENKQLRAGFEQEALRLLDVIKQLKAKHKELMKCYKMLLDWNRVEIKTKQAYVKLIEQILNESDVKK